MHEEFQTPGPAALYVEIGSGDITVRAEDVERTTVDVDGSGADETTVEQHGNQVAVVGPRTRGGFFGGGNGGLRVHVTLPLDSELVTKVGSADLDAGGRLGTVRLKSGSGDVRLDEVAGEALVESGSGDVYVDSLRGQARIKTGSGEVEIGFAGGETSVSTGSGDVVVNLAREAVAIKSGSGDLRVREAGPDLVLTTASGDATVDRMERGRLQVKNVSGDVRVAIPAGVPVWTDISCISGSVRSDLQGAGEPADDQPFVELRATTVSGDISLAQL